MECLICGNFFTPKRKTQVCCRKKCITKHWRKRNPEKYRAIKTKSYHARKQLKVFPRFPEIEGKLGLVWLTRGKRAVFDPAYIELIKAHSWTFSGYYAVARGGDRTVVMHRALYESHHNVVLATHEVVHHVNENKLDNRIANLELMSRAEHTRHHFKVKP